jgi:hypothetical protein
VLAVIKCIYLPPTYLHFIQDIEDRCLLLTSSTSFVDLPFQEHRMMEKHHIDQNPCISSLCPKQGIVTDNMTRGNDVAHRQYDLGMVDYKALIGLSLSCVPHFYARCGASLKDLNPDTTSVSKVKCFLVSR